MKGQGSVKSTGIAEASVGFEGIWFEGKAKFTDKKKFSGKYYIVEPDDWGKVTTDIRSWFNK